MASTVTFTPVMVTVCVLLSSVIVSVPAVFVSSIFAGSIVTFCFVELTIVIDWSASSNSTS